MNPLNTPAPLPRPTTATGDERRIGVEVEFAAVSAAQGARIVCDLYGGEVVEEDPHRFHVEGAEFGSFTCELDTQYAHRPKDATPVPEGEGGLAAFRTEMRKLLGDISSLVIPCEVVCPPIPHSQLPRLDALIDALQAAGAVGTRANPLYAFGAQLNPEVPGEDAETLTGFLKAYLLLSPWLRTVMSIDYTRRAVAFADPFPKPYVLKVTDPDYRPDLHTLIGDYLHHNPTRNREFDLLPLFAHLAPEIVTAQVSDPLIKPRPAFHYRLPDANLGRADWSLCLEWNRWCVVERLAGNRDLLDAMGRDFNARSDMVSIRSWPMLCSQWLVLT